MMPPENYSKSVLPLHSSAIENDKVAALSVRDLSFYYSTRKALECISMEIYENQITAIIGSSGCGKSTFLKALNRIGELEDNVRVTGSVEFYGQNIYDKRVNINLLRRKIGMVIPSNRD